MRILEENSEYLGVSKLLLMENAGAALAKVIGDIVEGSTRVLFICGLGNNGGDGMVAARHLSGNYHVTIYLLGEEGKVRTEEANYNLSIIKSLKYTVKLKFFRGLHDLEKLKEEISNSDVIIDAIFGTGLKGDIRSPFKEVIETINNSGKKVIAVDIPSGLNPDTGQVHGIAIKAYSTITFHKAKRGLIKKGAEKYVGKLYVASIGIPKEAEIICGPGDLRSVYKTREPWSKKGDHGRVLIIGGSKEYSGAPALSALASLRTGADLVVILSPEPASIPQKSFSPNIISIPLKGEYFNESHVDIVKKYSERFDVIVIGPGMGLRDKTLYTLCRLIKELKNKKLVIDADALKALKDSKVTFEGNVVLTPHAGEFKIIAGLSSPPPSRTEERCRCVKEFSRKVNAVVLLKGHEDVISNGDKVKVNRTGNPGMTVGGTGDVLTGIIATFLAWSGDPFESACAAAFINGVAGDFAFSEKGYHLLATDVIEMIPRAINEAINGKLRATRL